MKSRKRICYFGSYDLKEPHNTTFLTGLKAVGAEVVECRAATVEDRSQAQKYKSLFGVIRLLFTFIKNIFSLGFRLTRLKNLDAVIVGYPGFFDVPVAWIICKFKRVPVLFNVHISLYETLVVDRNYFPANSIVARTLKIYDRLLFFLSDTVIVDTASHGNYFSEIYGIKSAKFKKVYIGADSVYMPKTREENDLVNVLFYGSFIPLQGIEYIIKAAHLLQKDERLKFTIIGRGQTKSEMMQLAADLKVRNIEFIDWVTVDELVDHIAQADICLGGQFGLSVKADLVIGYKCFQMLACKKAVVVSSSKGNLELLEHGKTAWMCKAGDEHSLAEVIRTLGINSELRQTLADASWQVYNENCSPEVIGSELVKLIGS